MPPKLKTRTSSDAPIFGAPKPQPLPESVPDPTPTPPAPPIVPEFEEEESGEQEIEIVDEEIVSEPETIVVVDDEEDLNIDIQEIVDARAESLVNLQVEPKPVAAPQPEQKVSRNPFIRGINMGLPKIKL